MIYDATLPLSPDLPVWPGDPPIARELWGRDTKMGRWTLGNHAGTHVDAPAHLDPARGTVREIDPDVLIGPCRVLDLPNLPLLTADALRAQPVAGVARLLLRTRNSVQPTAEFRRDYTALDPGAAVLLRDAGVRLLGIDAPSVDPFESNLDAHRILLGVGIILVENLALAHVPAGDYDLICAPLPLDDADGAPARVWLKTIA